MRIISLVTENTVSILLILIGFILASTISFFTNYKIAKRNYKLEREKLIRTELLILFNEVQGIYWNSQKDLVEVFLDNIGEVINQSKKDINKLQLNYLSYMVYFGSNKDFENQIKELKVILNVARVRNSKNNIENDELDNLYHKLVPDMLKQISNICLLMMADMIKVLNSFSDQNNTLALAKKNLKKNSTRSIRK